MTILWIPHTPISEGAVRRDQHLIRHLAPHHRIISVTWASGKGKSLSAFADGLRFSKKTLSPRHSVYHVRRVPDLTRRFRSTQRDALWLNESLFQRDIRHIVEVEDPDVLITAYSAYMTGYPPFDIDIPVVFDYLDCARWSNDSPHERPYIEKADLVLAVSALAEEQAKRFNDNVVYLPNGADVQKLRAASGRAVRRKHGLEGATVVSLIGLMDSDYLIDAVMAAKEEIPGLKCLLVGRSPFLRSEIESRAGASDTFVYTGPVSYKEVADYFAASDIGLYPVPGVSYDDGRSPIKIFEYTAAGCPVVTPPIREVKRFGFSNLIEASPTIEAFSEGIVQACSMEDGFEKEIVKYDWQHLATRLSYCLQSHIICNYDNNSKDR